jgi:hypothetical protein
MVRGSCLCSAVRYEIHGPIDEIHHCHCSRCRKAHGAAFSTFAQVRAGDLRLTAGADHLRRYRSSPPVERSFCADCGASLFFAVESFPDLAWVAAGTFDEDPGVRPEAHIFVGSKAPWFAITDALPQHAAYPA